MGQVEARQKVAKICGRLGVSGQMFYGWQKQLAGMGLSQVRELRSRRYGQAP